MGKNLNSLSNEYCIIHLCHWLKLFCKWLRFCWYIHKINDFTLYMPYIYNSARTRTPRYMYNSERSPIPHWLTYTAESASALDTTAQSQWLNNFQQNVMKTFSQKKRYQLSHSFPHIYDCFYWVLAWHVKTTFLCTCELILYCKFVFLGTGCGCSTVDWVVTFNTLGPGF